MADLGEFPRLFVQLDLYRGHVLCMTLLRCLLETMVRVLVFSSQPWVDLGPGHQGP
jgi:hypothetical protein